MSSIFLNSTRTRLKQTSEFLILLRNQNQAYPSPGVRGAFTMFYLHLPYSLLLVVRWLPWSKPGWWSTAPPWSATSPKETRWTSSAWSSQTPLRPSRTSTFLSRRSSASATIYKTQSSLFPPLEDEMFVVNVLVKFFLSLSCKVIYI